MGRDSAELGSRARKSLRLIAGACFVFYLAWNLRFILRHQVPPSIWLAVTGLPGPTTGGVRSVAAAAHGDWRMSLALNPFTFLFVILLLISAVALGVRFLKGKRLVLPRVIVVGWLATLAIAWVLQIVRSLV